LSPCAMTNAHAARFTRKHQHKPSAYVPRRLFESRTVIVRAHIDRDDIVQRYEQIYIATVRERKHSTGVSSWIVSFPGSRSDTFFRRSRAASPNAARFFSQPAAQPRNPSSSVTLTNMQSRMPGAHQRRLSWVLDEAHCCGYLEYRCQLLSSWLCSGIIEKTRTLRTRVTSGGLSRQKHEGDMGRGILLWRLGVPIPTIVFLLLLG
jgi:hypothetical protein